MSTAIQTKASGIQASPRKLKKKKCKNPTCRAEFIPARPLQAACSVPCALQMVAAKLAKDVQEKFRKEQAEAKAARKKLKSRSDYMKETQQAFNEWIRMRDADQPCISCGRFHEGQWHAGHYRTVAGSPELRFEPLNVHKQCAPCNNHKSGDIVNYRINLVRRIGADKVDWLEGPHEPKRYTIDDLQAIKAHYRALTRELKRAAV